MSVEMKEVEYLCNDCDNRQTIRFEIDEQPLPVTNCVKCRAGFGREIGEQMQRRIGMFPVIQ